MDEALLEHPNVIQAVAFALPHPTLGEDLGAAVILRENTKTTEQELREFAFARLADHKVPSQIIIVQEIPKGPTGKLQRIGLAEKLASNLKTNYVHPRNSLQESLADIWAATLTLERVGIHDNFFSLGGDSLSATSMTLSIEKLVNKQLHPSIVFRAPTIEQLSVLLEDNPAEASSYLVPVQPKGDHKPLFLVPGHGGDVYTFVDLTRHLGTARPVYVFRFPEAARQDNDVANAMLKEMARQYISEMRSLQPEGPYLIGGFCYGGDLAFEMAQQLRAQGEKTDMVVIIYAYRPGSIHELGLQRRVTHHLKKFLEQNLQGKVEYLTTLARNLFEKISRRLFPTLSRRLIQDSGESTAYLPMYYPGKITLFRPLEEREGTEGLYHDPKMGWGGLAEETDVYETPGNKTTIFREPNVQVLAEQLGQCLDKLS